MINTATIYPCLIPCNELETTPKCASPFLPTLNVMKDKTVDPPLLKDSRAETEARILKNLKMIL
jgi:hypothetical protein